MARLETTDGAHVRLRPFRYQFPGPLKSIWDDWVICEWEVQMSDYFVRRRTDASFLTWELESIVEFFELVALGKKRIPSLRTVEPFVFGLGRSPTAGVGRINLRLDLPVPRLRLDCGLPAVAEFARQLAEECAVVPRRVSTTDSDQ